MALLKNKLLFFTTSPRTPEKMIPEVRLLTDNFRGMPWNRQTQEAFTEALGGSDFFRGSGSASDRSFTARDRINRAPKSLGFVDLKPSVGLTEAGDALINGNRPQEAYLRQLLKFQLPSPYHRETAETSGTFFIKPYLEMFRLVKDLKYLTFDEFKIFAVQMTDYREYDVIKDKIMRFRQEKTEHRGRHKQFVKEKWDEAVMDVFRSRIEEGRTRTRETQDASLEKFIRTEESNMRDYADAGFRYLRYTELVSISHGSHTISIVPERMKEVDFILENVSRDPVFIDDEERYKGYLFAAGTPVLYTDNRENLIEILVDMGGFSRDELDGMPLETLKDMRDRVAAQHRDEAVNEQVRELRDYEHYTDIIEMFNGINSYFDAPLMLEYNTWRAMTMLDGGDIQGNFSTDDEGRPVSTAPGNMPDIKCDYENFELAVEVTMQNGQRQYEMEGEPVARHYGRLKAQSGKETYCLFISPNINPATLAHFYGLNHLSIALYGGKSKIIPLNLNQFTCLIEHAYNHQTRPDSTDVKTFLDNTIAQGETAEDENDWKEKIQACVEKWMIA